MPEEFYLLLFAAIIAVVATAITVAIVVARYKTKLKAPIYPVDKYADLALTERQDVFLGSSVTRTRVSSSKRR